MPRNSTRQIATLLKRIAALMAWATLAALLPAPFAQAQSTRQEKASGGSAIRFYATNYGLFGHDVPGKKSGFVLPIDGARSDAYLFGSGLWFGARKRVGDSLNPLVFITYNPVSSQSWATPGEYSGDKSFPCLYSSLDFNHGSGACHDSAGGVVWPLWLAGASPVIPLVPGEFQPDSLLRTLQGTGYGAPAFMPGVDEQFVARFHDRELGPYEISPQTATESGYPIGLQVQQNIYAWRWGMFHLTVLLQYDIINVSGDTLFDCTAAQASDPDIGMTIDGIRGMNDHTAYYASRPELRTGFVWSDPDTLGMRFNPMAISLIEAPITNGAGFIDNSRRGAYELEGRVGGFPNWTEANDPRTTAERYDLMGSGMLASDAGATDQRALMASRQFHMRPGDTAHFAVAFSIVDSLPPVPHRDITRFAPAKQSAGNANPPFDYLITELLADYYRLGFGTSQLMTPLEPVADTGQGAIAFPNPAAERTAVSFTLARRSPATLRLVDNLGRALLSRPLGTLDAGTHRSDLDVTSLPSGVYFLIVATNAGPLTAKLNVAR